MNLEGKADVFSFPWDPPNQEVLTRLGEGLSPVRTHWLCSTCSPRFATICRDKGRESCEEGTGKSGRERAVCVCLCADEEEREEK